MTAKKLTFDITPDGMTIDQDGFKGATCLTELARFQAFMKDNGIDMTVTNQKKKPAFYQPAGTEKSGSKVI